MANGLKYGNKNLTAIQFDAPIVGDDYDFDFTTWTLNPNNSAGVTVTKSSITVTKVKPKEWFIRSNDGYSTGTDRDAAFLNKKFRLSGLQDLWTNGDITESADNPLGDTSKTYYPLGLIISPIRVSDGTLLSHVYPWDMNIPSGYFKHVYGHSTGWNIYGYGYDEECALYNWNCGYASYGEVAFAFWTGTAPDNDEYLTLSAPFVISLQNHSTVDPTTIEGYRAALGEDMLYAKTKSFANTLLAHGLVNKQIGTYQYPTGNAYHPIISSSVENGQQYAYPIGGRYFDSTARFTIKDTTGDASLFVNGFYFLESLGWYPNVTQIAVGDTVTIYGKIIGVRDAAVITSCSTQEHSGRIYALNGVMSIIGNQHDAPGTPGSAGTLAEPYTVANALAHAKTLGNGTIDSSPSYITGKITSITSPFAPPYWEYYKLRFPVPTDLAGLITSAYPLKFWCTQYDDQDHPGFWAAVADVFEDFDIIDGKYCSHLFANSGGNLDELTFNFDVGSGGYIDIGDMFNHSNLVETVNFNITSGVLKSLHNTFISCSTIKNVNFNTLVNISDFSGAFEGSVMTTFPANVGASVDWQTNLSEPTTMINYAADGSMLITFGNYKNESAQQETDKFFTAVVNPYCIGAFARSNITTIKYILDMKFVSPLGGNICDYWDDIDDSSLKLNAIFNNQNIETLLLKNLNKGNWSFDNVVRADSASHKACAGNLPNLDATSINYMLSNVFDLRWNTSKADRLENEFNSFNGWLASGGTKRPTIWEYISSNSTLTKTLSTNGEMHVIITAVGCTFKVNGVTQSPGTRTLSLSAGSCTLSFEKNPEAQTMSGTLTLDTELDADNAPKYRFMSELTSGLSSANIYLPSEAGSKINSAALATANERGWTVYVGGNEYTITP